MITATMLWIKSRRLYTIQTAPALNSRKYQRNPGQEVTVSVNDRIWAGSMENCHLTNALYCTVMLCPKTTQRFTKSWIPSNQTIIFYRKIFIFCGKFLTYCENKSSPHSHTVKFSKGVSLIYYKKQLNSGGFSSVAECCVLFCNHYYR